MLASALAAINLSVPPSSPLQTNGFDGMADETLVDDEDRSDSDEEEQGASTHPNKYPVEIESHDNAHCSYRRQPTR